jgi:hypothetical protein
MFPSGKDNWIRKIRAGSYRLLCREFVNCNSKAGVAQLVEQLIRNQQVGGSNPPASSKMAKLKNPAHGGVFKFIAILRCRAKSCRSTL